MAQNINLVKILLELIGLKSKLQGIAKIHIINLINILLELIGLKLELQAIANEI